MVSLQTSVGVHTLSATHNAANFYRPDAFVPERWLPECTTEPTSSFYGDRRGASQPFSVGPRNCLGKSLAYNEMRVILARLLWNFDMELCEESKNWHLQPTYVVWDKSPLMCYLHDIRHVKRETASARSSTIKLKTGERIEKLRISSDEKGGGKKKVTANDVLGKTHAAKDLDGHGNFKEKIVDDMTPRKENQIKDPRPPKPALRLYDTRSYGFYDHKSPQAVTPVPGPFTSFTKYNKYLLYIKPDLDDPANFPTVGVDLTISRVVEPFSGRQLHKNLPAEFDRHGMIRATRIPFGLPAKLWANQGQMDVDGNIVGPGNSGWYYKWGAWGALPDEP